MKSVVKKLAVLLLILAAMAQSLVSAWAESYPFEGITTAVLRMRSGASTTSGIITELPRGTYVTVTGVKNDFYIISVSGRTGYAARAYIAKAAAPAPTSPPQVASVYTQITAASDAADIRTLQLALKELGFYTSSVDGKLGSGTTKAISAFQTMNGLSATGKADAKTL